MLNVKRTIRSLIVAGMAFAVAAVAACGDGGGETTGIEPDSASDRLERFESMEGEMSILAPKGWELIQTGPRSLLLGGPQGAPDEVPEELKIIRSSAPPEIRDSEDLSQMFEQLQPAERRDDREVAGQQAIVAVFLGRGTKELRANFIRGDELWSVSLLFDPSKADSLDTLWDEILDSLAIAER